MRRRRAFALLALLVAASLVGAPVTMADWGEQATFSVAPVDPSAVDEETPVLRYENLSNPAQSAVRRAVESPDHLHVVYGSEDHPEDFFYSDYSEPGQGLYVVVYEGQHYRLTTYAGGGFPFVYWLYELPFVAYGLLLGGVAVGVARADRPTESALIASVPGLAFHALGPEFDFPLLAPMQFVGLGLVGTLAFVAVLVWRTTRQAGGRDAP